MSNEIPAINLRQQFSNLAPQLEQAVMSVLSSGSYILGEQVKRLEKEIAELCGCQYGIGVANGTDALELSVWALDIGPGDEVITPSFTFAATVEAIVLKGATPVFVDIDPFTFNMDPALIEKAISKNTKAIMPVHLYGLPADMDAIMDLAKKYYLKVIEDNAQAIGATYKGKPTGSFGDLACLSFYPTKNLAACGDAGMIVTNNAQLAERLIRLRAHGMKKRYFHDELGVNSRLDELQAAILLTKLPYLKNWNEKRRSLAKTYDQFLRPISWLKLPDLVDSGDNQIEHVWHQYTVLVDFDGKAVQSTMSSVFMRDTVIEKLAQNGIGAMCYYPLPLHLQKAFARFDYKKGDLPVTEKLADQVISLPMYPELEEKSIEKIAAVLQKIGQELMAMPLPATVAVQV